MYFLNWNTSATGHKQGTVTFPQAKTLPRPTENSTVSIYTQICLIIIHGYKAWYHYLYTEKHAYIHNTNVIHTKKACNKWGWCHISKGQHLYIWILVLDLR